MAKKLHSEKIAEISKAVYRHRDLEISTNTANSAVGRVETVFNNQGQQFWLINKEGQINAPRDWLGNIIANNAFQINQPYNGDGYNVPKNSRLGEIFITNEEGSHIHTTPNGDVIVEILNRAVYEPTIVNFAEDITIRLAGSKQIFTYTLLDDILKLQKSIDIDEEKLEIAKTQNHDEEVKELLQKIDDKKKNMDEIGKSQIFHSESSRTSVSANFRCCSGKGKAFKNI